MKNPIHIGPKLDLPESAVTQTFAVLAKRGMGKALALDTPIPTVDGWTTMGSIRLGETIFDETGRPCRVTYVAPIQEDRPCYRVRFSDRSEIVADGEHLWLTESLASRRADGQQGLRARRGRGVGRGNRPQCARSVFPAIVKTQRRALLAGLMDSDGTIASDQNTCRFDNKNERLADAVYELVVSLGWQARRSVRTARLRGKDCGDSHRVLFCPTEQVFRLRRKAQRLRLDVKQRSRSARRMIVAVDPIESVPVRCIAVDSPSHLFLAGRACVPTHNTYLAAKMVEQMIGAGLPVGSP